MGIVFAALIGGAMGLAFGSLGYRIHTPTMLLCIALFIVLGFI